MYQINVNFNGDNNKDDINSELFYFTDVLIKTIYFPRVEKLQDYANQTFSLFLTILPYHVHQNQVWWIKFSKTSLKFSPPLPPPLSFFASSKNFGSNDSNP